MGGAEVDGVRYAQKAWATLAVIAGVVILVDQVTKSWALDALRDEPLHVLGSLKLSLAFNRGMAFGIGEGVAPYLVAFAIVGILLVFLRRQERLAAPAVVGLGLVLGGAVGNVVDRLFRDHGGAVVDFIDLQWWPVFNVADSCVVAGAILLVAWGTKQPELDRQEPVDTGDRSNNE